jgi:hypothetical protein
VAVRTSDRAKRKLPGRELNPGHCRDRAVYSPLYYRGSVEFDGQVAGCCAPVLTAGNLNKSPPTRHATPSNDGATCCPDPVQHSNTSPVSKTVLSRAREWAPFPFFDSIRTPAGEQHRGPRVLASWSLLVLLVSSSIEITHFATQKDALPIVASRWSGRRGGTSFGW